MGGGGGLVTSMNARNHRINVRNEWMHPNRCPKQFQKNLEVKSASSFSVSDLVY